MDRNYQELHEKTVNYLHARLKMLRPKKTHRKELTWIHVIANLIEAYDACDKAFDLLEEIKQVEIEKAKRVLRGQHEYKKSHSK